MNLQRILGFATLVSVLAVAGFMTSARATMEDKEVSSTPAVAVVSVSAPKSSATIDLKTALAPRTMGDPKAPVKLDEYASLSCPHCAAFTKETFDQIKTRYIDTGKVLYTYTDLPLNAPALEAAMVSRCLPPEHYFQFVKFLFETQEKWAFNDKYEDSLRQNSKLLGMSDEMFDACINNKDLKMGIVAKAEEAGKTNHIELTPSFVFSNGQIMHGAEPFASFQKILDPLTGSKDAKVK